LHPKISWQTRCSEDPAGALSTGAHIAICMTPRPPDGPWIAKKIMELDERLLATPGYLEKNGTPKTVDDLRSHRLLVWEAHGRAECELPRKDGTTLAIVPALCMNDVFLLRQAALRDLGIVFAPEGPVPLEFLFGEEALVGVLEGEVGRKTALWFLAHATTLELPYGRMMVDHLKRLFDSLR
jgi:DNA-binding transcriptional LysR family regulator